MSGATPRPMKESARIRWKARGWKRSATASRPPGRRAIGHGSRTYIGEFTRSRRSTCWFRELLILELTYRRRFGERPTPEEYLCRFPDEQVAVINAVYGVKHPLSGAPVRFRAGPLGDDRNLLFGLLALQNSFIDRDTLLAAFNAWVLRQIPGTSLGRDPRLSESHGRRRGPMPCSSQCSGPQAPADARRAILKRASSVPQLELGSVRADLEGVADPELQTCLTRVASNHDRVVQATTAVCSSTAGTAGTRFRVLRLHRTGGLGAVYLARDEELHREVALKEIRDQHANDPDSRSRFVQEAEITGRLEHPGIVPGLQARHRRYADGRPFYAMRFIKGRRPQRRHPPSFTRQNVPAAIQGGRKPCCYGELLGRFGRRLQRDGLTRTAEASCTATSSRTNILRGTLWRNPCRRLGTCKAGRSCPRRRARTEEQVTLRPDSGSRFDRTTTLPGDTPGTAGLHGGLGAGGRRHRPALGPPSDVYSLGATLYCLPHRQAAVRGPRHRRRYGESAAPNFRGPAGQTDHRSCCSRRFARRRWP